MKLLLSTLAATATLAAAALLGPLPAAAQPSGTYASEDQYRMYCRDDAYYRRYESYCRRFDDDNDGDYDDNDYDDGYDGGAYDDDGIYRGHHVRNSNYNHNRSYLRGYRTHSDGDYRDDSTSHYSRTGTARDRDDDQYYDDEDAVPGRMQGNTGGTGQGNDSNSYTGQRSTTH
jgi:hypothetical protein